MFVSLSKAFSKFGNIRLGVRITKKNAAWMFFVMLFVWLFQMVWYMAVLCFWFLYAVCYGCVWCVKKLFGKLRGE